MSVQPRAVAASRAAPGRCAAVVAAAAAVVVLGCPSHVRADRTYVGPASGPGANWSIPANWSPAGVPSNESAFITNSDATSRTVLLDTNALLGPNVLILYNTGSGTNTLNMTSPAFSINVGTFLVGSSSGGGTLNQSGGSINATVGGFELQGGAAAEQGVYNLSGSGSLTSTSTFISTQNGGFGTMSQTNGTHQANFLYVGYTANATGTYTLTGGTATVNNNMSIASNTTTSNGTFNLGGSGSLTTPALDVGLQGVGLMQQTGGTANVTGGTGIRIGQTAGAFGTATFSGGTMTTPTISVGGSESTAGGRGVLNINPGAAITVTNGLKIWNTTNTAVNLSGGMLRAQFLDTSTNPSRFNWTGGTLHLRHALSGAVVVDNAGAFGANLAISAGKSLVVGMPGYSPVSYSALQVGSISSTGTLTQSGGDVTVYGVTYVQSQAGGLSRYTFSGGSLTTGIAYIGNFGNGVFDHTGGTLTAGPQPFPVEPGITIAANPGASGTYNLSGSGELIVNEDVDVGGYSGTGVPGGAGVFNVAGGSALVTGRVKVYDTTGTALNLSGGTLAVNTMDLSGNVSRFNWTGGTLAYNDFAGLEVGATGPIGASVNVTPTKTLHVAETLNVTSGLVTLSGGTVIANALNVNGNPGRFDWTAGTLRINGLGGMTVGFAGALGDTLSVGAGKTLGVVATAGVADDGVLLVDGGTVNATSIANDGEIQLGGGLSRLTGGTMTNNGLLLGDGRVATALTNTPAGEIRASGAQRLVFPGAPVRTNHGAINFVNGGTVEFGGVLTNTSTGRINGRGTFIATGGLVNAGQFTLSSGPSEVFAPVTNNNGGKVIVTGNSTGTFYGPITANAGSEFRVSTGSTAVFFGNVTGFGAGTFTGGGVKQFEAGVSNVGPLATAGSTIVEPTASLTAASIREASLTVRGSVTINPDGTAAGLSRVASLTVEDGGTLHLSDNDLLVDYGGASVEGYVRDRVRQGRLAGTGITSTPGTPDDDKVLAVADNADFGRTAWLGQSIDTSTVIGKYTFFGDANMDGKVTGDDYVAVDANLGTGNSWLEGDFNMNGTTTGDDYVAIDANLGKGTPTPLAYADLKAEMVALHVAMFGEEYLVKLADAEENGFAVVPEPGGLGLTLLVAASALRRRRRP